MENVKRGRVVMTWVRRSGGVSSKHVKKALRDLARETTKVVPQGGTLFSICESYDTYQTGGLYPLMHLSQDATVLSKVATTKAFLDPMVLGPENVIDQGLFEEVASIRPSQQASASDSTVMVMSAFKSIEPAPNATLVKEWKNWTGARAYLQEMKLLGLHCIGIKFLVKLAPYEEAGGFCYVVLMKVVIKEPSQEGIVVDMLQRFRVERWSGYSTIYRTFQ